MASGDHSTNPTAQQACTAARVAARAVLLASGDARPSLSQGEEHRHHEPTPSRTAPGPEATSPDVVGTQMYRGSVSKRSGIQARGGVRRPHSSKELSLQDLRPFFNLSREEAAQELGLGLSTLKRCCSRLGIARWPHRKLASLKALRVYHVTRNPPTQEAQAIVDSIDMEIEAIMQDPNHKLDVRVDNERVSKYKTAQRKRSPAPSPHTANDAAPLVRPTPSAPAVLVMHAPPARTSASGSTTAAASLPPPLLMRRRAGPTSGAAASARLHVPPHGGIPAAAIAGPCAALTGRAEQPKLAARVAAMPTALTKHPAATACLPGHTILPSWDAAHSPQPSLHPHASMRLGPSQPTLACAPSVYQSSLPQTAWDMMAPPATGAINAAALTRPSVPYAQRRPCVANAWHTASAEASGGAADCDLVLLSAVHGVKQQQQPPQNRGGGDADVGDVRSQVDTLSDSWDSSGTDELWGTGGVSSGLTSDMELVAAAAAYGRLEGNSAGYPWTADYPGLFQTLAPPFLPTANTIHHGMAAPLHWQIAQSMLSAQVGEGGHEPGPANEEALEALLSGP